MIQVQSRAAIMASAREAYLAGKTIHDCPGNMRHFRDVWKFEFEQCQFEASANGDQVRESV
jgi:hypothetical protein